MDTPSNVPDDTQSSGGWGYLLWSSLFIMILAGLILYLFRHWWLPTARAFPNRWPSWLPNGGRYSFLHDQQAGFSSDAFDLSGNIESGDSRAGLDPTGKREIQTIMQNNPGMSFDDARALFTKNKFASNNIGPDGRPTDPRAVFFS